MRYLISYGNEKFKNSRERIKKQAIDLDIFDSVTVYTPEDLPKDFTEKFNTVLSMNRGAGYWIWKPFIVHNTLLNIKDGDLLVYVDSGCSINKRGLKRLLEYEEMVNNHPSGILGMMLDDVHPEKRWTTTKIFEYFNVQESIKDSNQIHASVIVIKKCENSMNIISQWIKTLHDDSSLFTDVYNGYKPDFKFVDNRHDQSIFSIVMKINNGLTIPDETYTPGNYATNLYDKPMWVTRIRN